MQKRSAFLDTGANALGAQDWMNDISSWGPEMEGAFRINQNDPTAFRFTTKRTPM